MPPLSKVVVIGKGRFGNAIAQGLRDGGFVEHDDGTRVLCEVVQVSASKFPRLDVSQMAHELQDAAFVAYCGTKLPEYTTTLALALQLASKKLSLSKDTAIEFLDFSNPDPVLENADVSGAIDLWVALNALRDGEDEELLLKKNEGALIKVSKVAEVGSIDASGAVGNTNGLVYSSHPGHIPRIFIPNLVLKSAGPNADLYEEARNRIQERSGIDCWHDGNILGLAIFAFTSAYAIIRYDKNLNGVEPHANIPMYLLDKGFAWTGLWMVVISPFAGNLLTLCSIYQKWSTVPLSQQLVALICSLFMILPTVLFSVCWLLWIVARNLYFSFLWPVSDMYLSQTPTSYPSTRPRVNWLKASLVDIVNLKGEAGVIGFIYALVHSFLGIIIADAAYKTKWFVTEEQDSNAGGNGVGVGRMDWEFELSVTTGAMGTALLWAVAMRSIMGKASWIRLKPMYAYVSPIAIWFSTIHVIAFGAKGWNTLFNPKYHNGQLSITFVSSMFPTCILLVHHTFTLFGTKKTCCAGDHLWKHSIVNIATERNNRIRRKTRNIKADNDTAVTDCSDTNSELAFYSFVYTK